MSKLRPECGSSKDAALSDDTALYLIRYSVSKRRSLIYGRLNDKQGGHCAIGCFWADNPGATLRSSLIDEVAAVNDSVKGDTPHQRWKKVNGWLRWKLQVLAAAKK